MTWAAVRDRLRSPSHRGVLGRQVAERVVEAMRVALAGDRRVFVLGSWRQVFGALGLPVPSDRAGRAAMRLLEQLTDAVVRVTAQTWRVCSHGCDRPTAEQLELRYEETRKAESAPTGQAAQRRAPRKSLRARARALALELVWGRRPACPRGKRLAGAVRRAQLEGQPVVAVTLTAGLRGDGWARVAATRFVEEVGGRQGQVELVPERTRAGELHWHGVVIGIDALGVDRATRRVNAIGQYRVEQVDDPRRAAFWAGHYSWKGPAEGVEVMSTIDYEERPGLAEKAREAWRKLTRTRGK